MDRRDFFRNGLPLATLTTGTGLKHLATSNPAISPTSFNSRDFGAKGDGKTDDTKAIQAAIEAASGTGGDVFIPAGLYMCGELKMKKFTGLVGEAKWSFSNSGGTILRLNTSQAKCLIDITECTGSRLTGICVDGSLFHKEKPIHGIYLANPGYKTEDGFQITACRAENFSGDGFRFDHVWCFSIRGSQSYNNAGCGLRIQGWDGFILDNWFSLNGQAGIGAYDPNSACTVTGNRIEWNHKGGIALYAADHWQITGNYIDRSGGCGIGIYPRGSFGAHNLTVTGNIIGRSGKPDYGFTDEYDNSHARFEKISGLLFANNCLYTGRDDNNSGVYSPDFGIVVKDLNDSIIKDNTLSEGAVKKLIVDLGGHGPNFIIKDNIGSLRTK